MVLPQKDKVGSHISSRDFPFQECTTKSVILINELTLASQAESELYKNILGGEPTYINVKNRPASLLHRKPVFLTSNEPIYRFVSNEKIPLLNRMIAHMNLTTSTIIQKYTTKGIPSPGYLTTAFKNIEHLQQQLHIPTNETFMDHQEEILAHLTEDLLTIKTDTNLPEEPHTILQSLQQTTSTSVEQSTQTEPMEVQPTSETTDAQTQTETHTTPDNQTPSTSRPPINTVAPFDAQRDKEENPDSSFNINREAHLSDLEVEHQPHVIVIQRTPSPPRSPDTSNESIQDTPTRRENQTSTPIRRTRPPFRRTPYSTINRRLRTNTMNVSSDSDDLFDQL